MTTTIEISTPLITIPAPAPVAVTVSGFVATGVVADASIRRVRLRLLARAVPDSPIDDQRSRLDIPQAVEAVGGEIEGSFLNKKSKTAVVEVPNIAIIIITFQFNIHVPNIPRNRSLAAPQPRAFALRQVLHGVAHGGAPRRVVAVEALPGDEGVGVASHDGELVGRVVDREVSAQAQRRADIENLCAIDIVAALCDGLQNSELAVEGYFGNFGRGVVHEQFWRVECGVAGDQEIVVLVAFLGGAEGEGDAYAAAAVGAAGLRDGEVR